MIDLKFTDDDLEQLKEDIKRQPLGLTQSSWEALLARLDAAENAKRSHYSFENCMCDACQVWRKAAGK